MRYLPPARRNFDQYRGSRRAAGFGGPSRLSTRRFGDRGYDDERRYGNRRTNERFFDDDRYYDDRGLGVGFGSPQRWFADQRVQLADSPWFDVVFGCLLFVCLNTVFKELTTGAFKTAEANAAVGRLLSIGTFAAVQEAAFLPVSQWISLYWPGGFLRDDYRNDYRDRGYRDRGDYRDVIRPFFANPLLGVTFAFLFSVPLSAIASAAKVSWLAGPKFSTNLDGVLLNLIAAPISEELFFRAWLPEAVILACGSESAAFIISTILFGFYHVPISQVMDGAHSSASLLIAYQALGGYLCFLYQRSGGSLPLVVITHATLRLIELGGARVLPFGLW